MHRAGGAATFGLGWESLAPGGLVGQRLFFIPAPDGRHLRTCDIGRVSAGETAAKIEKRRWNFGWEVLGAVAGKRVVGGWCDAGDSKPLPYRQP